MFYFPLGTKVGHFRDVFPSQSLSMVLQKQPNTRKVVCVNKPGNTVTRDKH